MDEVTLLREFRADTEPCDDLTLARAKADLRAQFGLEADGVDQPRRRRLSRRAHIAAAALVLGAGLGFGFATWLTPSGSATSSFVGFGFLPVKGWTVVQSGTVGATGAATAIAANVPLDPADRLGRLPSATIGSLPANGVLIFASFTTRGDPDADARFPVRALPLRLAGAVPVTPAQYQLRAGVEGYNVDARIFVGSSPPSPELLADARRQLDRLVVGAERVTIFARPTVLGDQAVQLFGSIDSGKAGEVVDIQAKACGQQFFRGVAGATTREGGGWSRGYFAGITTTFRAIWDGDASEQVIVRQRALVRLRLVPFSKQFEVGVVARTQFWRRHVVIQRFDRRLGTWLSVKPVLLTKQAAAGTFVWTSARFTTSLPKGTLIRAVFPLDQARPCYLAGVSPQVRT